ncbi:PUB4 [Symbiodinium sp. CCMP2456]|nr:PUB4 [Symbiodinium sp. CCMP2456]
MPSSAPFEARHLTPGLWIDVTSQGAAELASEKNAQVVGRYIGCKVEPKKETDGTSSLRVILKGPPNFDERAAAKGDLCAAARHLGYVGVNHEASIQVASQLSEYHTLDLEEFVVFLEQYTMQEQAEIERIFANYAGKFSQKVPLRAVPAIAHDLGLTSLQAAISESLDAAQLSSHKALSVNQLRAFLAAHLSAEGYTKEERDRARQAFDQVREGKSDLPPRSVGDAMALFRGADARQEWDDIWHRLGKRSSPKTNMSLPHTTLIPNVNLRNIIQSIRVRMPAIQSEQIKSIKEMQDLEAIVRSLMEDQGKLAVTCIDPTRSPESSPAAYCSSPNAPKAPNIPKLPPPDRASMEEPIPVLLSLLRHESKEVSERALGLIDGLVAADPRHRDAVWHHGGIPLIVSLLRGGSSEQLQHASTLLRTLASSQAEAQMAITWAGAIPLLVEHLDHDFSKVRVESAKALWSLAQGNMDNETSIVEHGGIKRLVVLLSGGAADARDSVLHLLLNLASHDPLHQDNITRAGAIPPLTELLNDGNLRQLAAAVLKSLARDHEDNQSAIGATSGTIQKLIQLLSDESAAMRESAAGVLHVLVAGGHAKNVATVSRSGGIRPCMELLKDENAGAREDAAGVLAALAKNADNRVHMADLGAIPLLIELVQDHVGAAAAARKYAATALGELAVRNSKNKEVIGKTGGIEALVELLKDGDHQARGRAASALSELCQLSDHNKLSMVGAGAIPLLVELLREDSTKKPAKAVLASLAGELEANKKAIQEAASAAKVDESRSGPSVDFHEFLVWARRLEVQELSPLRDGFYRVDKDADGMVSAGEFLDMIPSELSLVFSAKLSQILKEGGVAPGQLLSFDDAVRVLRNIRSTGNQTKQEIKEFEEVFKLFDSDNSGKMDVTEMVDVRTPQYARFEK